jgi:hypothetical protein
LSERDALGFWISVLAKTEMRFLELFLELAIATARISGTFSRIERLSQ